jgi:hypothetical protein
MASVCAAPGCCRSRSFGGVAGRRRCDQGIVKLTSRTPADAHQVLTMNLKVSGIRYHSKETARYNNGF